VLQPLSLQGQAGLDIAGGIGAMELHPVRQACKTEAGRHRISEAQRRRWHRANRHGRVGSSFAFRYVVTRSKGHVHFIPRCRLEEPKDERSVEFV
jgi:hypothetical protein